MLWRGPFRGSCAAHRAITAAAIAREYTVFVPSIRFRDANAEQLTGRIGRRLLVLGKALGDLAYCKYGVADNRHVRVADQQRELDAVFYKELLPTQ